MAKVEEIMELIRDFGSLKFQQGDSLALNNGKNLEYGELADEKLMVILLKLSEE